MSEPLVVLSQLKAKFAQFDQMAEIVGRLQQELADINNANGNAAGHNDAVAKAYHGQADKPTQSLVDLVQQIQTLLGLTGGTGQDVVTLIDNAENNAQEAAKGW